LQAFVEVQIEGKKIIVQSESAGKRLFGGEAVISKVEGNEAVLDFYMKGPETVPLEMLAPVADFEDPKKQKKVKGFNSVNRTDLKRLLKFAGYKVSETDEAGEGVQDETKAGGMIYSLNLAASYRLMQTSLEISDDDLEFVHPDLLKNYMECRAGPEAGSGGSFLFVSRLEGEQGWVREG